MTKCVICDHDDENTTHLALDMEYYDPYNKVDDDGLCFRCWKLIDEYRELLNRNEELKTGEVEHTIEDE